MTVKSPSKGWLSSPVVFWICLALIIVVHFIFLMGRFAPAISDPDANGYWAQGSLLFTTGRTWFKPEADAQYIGMHWLVTDSGRYYSRYPAGLAVITGAVYSLLGYKASVMVNPALASLTLLGLGLLVRRMLGNWWALAAVFVLAVNPLFNQHAILCFAHIAVMAFLSWGLYFLFRWSDGGGLLDAFLAGVLLGCIPTIRYPEALFGLAAGVFMLMHLRSRRKIWLHCLVALAGAAIPLAPLLIHNQMAFGAFYRTAYSLTNEQTGFGWDYFRQHWINYIRGLNGEGAGPFLLLGAVGMVCMCCIGRYRRMGILLGLLALPSLLLYMAYYWGGRGGGMDGMRFLLPTFICYITAGVWLLARITHSAPAVPAACGIAAVLLLQFLWGGLHTGDEGMRTRYGKQVLVIAADALEKHVEPGSVVISNNQILQHLDFVRQWKLAELNQPGLLRMPRREMDDADSDEPSPMQAEKIRQRLLRYKDLTGEQRERLLAQDLRRWAGDKRIYYIGPEQGLDQLGRLMLSRKNFKIIATVPLPEPPKISAMNAGRGPMGRQMTPGTMPAARPGGTQFPPPDGMQNPRPGGMQGPPPGGGMQDTRPGGIQGPPPGGMPGPMPGQFQPMPPGGMQGHPMAPGPMGGQGNLAGVKELVIAEWTFDG